MFFFLTQNEYGDLFKITFECDGTTVSNIVVTYFDTVSPSNAICVMRSGHLFVAAEFGNQLRDGGLVCSNLFRLITRLHICGAASYTVSRRSAVMNRMLGLCCSKTSASSLSIEFGLSRIS